MSSESNSRIGIDFDLLAVVLLVILTWGDPDILDGLIKLANAQTQECAGEPIQ